MSSVSRQPWAGKVLPSLLLVLFLPCLGYYAQHHADVSLRPPNELEEHQAATRPATASERAQEDDIREAALRYGMAGDAPSSLYFIWVADGRGLNPKGQVLSRFASPRVRPGSDAAMRGAREVHDRVTGEPGTVVLLSGIRWISHTEVEVDETACRRMSHKTGLTYRLSRRDGEWSVTEARRGWS